jgi:hypothetical protein
MVLPSPSWAVIESTGETANFELIWMPKGCFLLADVPEDNQVYLEKPIVGVPETPPGKKGRPFSRLQVLNQVQPVKVHELVSHPETVWQQVAVRHTERGLLTYRCTARRVWTITEKGEVLEEWLFIRKESDGTFSFPFD